jgi:hypothetical protein
MVLRQILEPQLESGRVPHHRSFRSQTLHYFARPHDEVPSEAIESPAAWSAEQMRGDPERWQFVFSPSQIEELEAALAATRRFESRLDRMRPRDFALPTLAVEAAIWRSSVAKGRGFVLLRGLPVQRWTSSEIERAFWGLGLHMGSPGAQNDDGDLLGHVIDERLDESADVRQYRTAQEIPFHCDAADAVALLCVRKAKEGGASRIASSVSIFNSIFSERPELARRLFGTFSLDTHAEQGVAFVPMHAARHFRGQLRTFIHPGYFRSGAGRPGAPALDAAGHEVLELYERLASAPSHCLEMSFEPGDVQLLSNHTIVHARGGYVDAEVLPLRRHLLRLWLSFEASRVEPKERWLRSTAKIKLAAELVRGRL